MIAVDIVFNLGVMTALSVISGFIGDRWGKARFGTVLQGVLFGGIAIIGMLKPLSVGPGIILDGRSVVLGLCSLFFGPLPSAIALALSVPLRIYQGGAGALMGVLVMLSSSLLGLPFYYRYAKHTFAVSGWNLLGFGFLVHAAVVALIFTLPPDIAKPLFAKIALPLLTLYPLATVLVGKIISDSRSRQHYVEKLKERELQLSSYINGSPDGVFLSDENGRYIDLNPAAERITGYSRDELLSKTIPELLAPETLDAALAHFQRVKESGKADGEFLFVVKGGTKRWWSVEAVKITGDRYLGFAKDITGRRQAEEKIQVLLGEKDLLLREVHHRIKNNMTSIKGLLSLQMAAEKNAATVASLKDAESRVQSMIVLYDKLYCTDNYRELSVKGYLKPLAEQIVGSFSNKAIISLEILIDDFILNVRALSPLGIIVNELVTNTMKFAFEGREEGKIVLSAFCVEGHVTVSLEDDGVGIPDDVTFEKSSGFGMQIVRMLTEQLGGEIRIEKGRGSKFILEFDL